MLKNDRWIREMAGKGMIEPFVTEQVMTQRHRQKQSFALPHRLPNLTTYRRVNRADRRDEHWV